MQTEVPVQVHELRTRRGFKTWASTAQVVTPHSSPLPPPFLSLLSLLCPLPHPCVCAGACVCVCVFCHPNVPRKGLSPNLELLSSARLAGQ